MKIKIKEIKKMENKIITGARNKANSRFSIHQYRNLADRQDGVAYFEMAAPYRDIVASEWMATGRFSGEEANIVERMSQEFPPEKVLISGLGQTAENGKNSGWKKLNGDLDFIDLSFGESHRTGEIAYALTHVYSPTRRPTRLSYSADYWIKFWLDGRLIKDTHVTHVVKGAKSCPVELETGWNTLLVKVGFGSDSAGFWMAISDPGDLRFAAAPETIDQRALKKDSPENERKPVDDFFEFLLNARICVKATSREKDATNLLLCELLAPVSGIPSRIDEIILEVEAEEWRSDSSASLPPVRLDRKSGFKAAFPPLAPGYYRIRCRPVAVAGKHRIAGNWEGFSCLYHADTPLPLPAASEKHTKTAMTPIVEHMTEVLPLDGDAWFIATDHGNEGVSKKWFDFPVKDAKPTKAPWVIQDIFPGYHGVAWYWRKFHAPKHFHPAGRFLLKFQAVDYLGDVWVNGKHIGRHEGGETPFTLDATDAIIPDGINILAVRVLNPTYEPIDGTTLPQTPKGAKQYPVATNSVYNCGGIVDSVELCAVPPLRIEHLHVIPDWKTGEIQVRLNVRNSFGRPLAGIVQLSVAPATTGTTSRVKALADEFRTGDTLVVTALKVENHKLWDVSEPFLYRVTARVAEDGVAAADEHSVRCGFRDFRFENGYFRLNGKRIFLDGSLYVAQYPAGYVCPDPDMIRRDVLLMKSMGFNFCRIAFGGSASRQIDVFDELGVLVYMEHYASWQIETSDRLKRLYEQSFGEIILRDRNHPSVVAWGFLNEITTYNPVFRYALEFLPFARYLDDTRMFFLNSGRYDNVSSLGSICNPVSAEWENVLRDAHSYSCAPLSAKKSLLLRTNVESNQDISNPVFMTEFGHCGAIDLFRTMRHYERIHRENSDDAKWHASLMEKFQREWNDWRLGDIWPRMEDFFSNSHKNLARLREIGENALRASPRLVGLSSTNSIVDGFCGNGTSNEFRELKPGMTDVVCELTASLRWCLFVEPVTVYRGARVKLEAVLVNHDVLAPGKYPVRLQIIGPGLSRLWEKMVEVEIPCSGGGRETPFARPVFSDELTIDGSSGEYRFYAALERGGAASGGETVFFVFDPAEMPSAARELVLWGEDAVLEKWISEHGVNVLRWRSKPMGTCRMIAVGGGPAAGGDKALAELFQEIERGSTALFLDPAVFADGTNSTSRLPLKEKGVIGWNSAPHMFYRHDTWARKHPVFDGLPAGGIMDPVLYREILPQHALMGWNMFDYREERIGLDCPEEAVCGSHRIAPYVSGLHVAVFRHGNGRFIFNNLKIVENIGLCPVAERLLRNMLNYAAKIQAATG